MAWKKQIEQSLQAEWNDMWVFQCQVRIGKEASSGASSQAVFDKSKLKKKVWTCDSARDANGSPSLCFERKGCRSKRSTRTERYSSFVNFRIVVSRTRISWNMASFEGRQNSMSAYAQNHYSIQYSSRDSPATCADDVPQGTPPGQPALLSTLIQPLKINTL